MPSDEKLRQRGAAPAPPSVAGDDPASLDDVERALLAQLHFASGGWQQGLDISRSAGPGSRGLRLLEARGWFGMGQHSAALELLDRLLCERPGDVLALYYKAQFLGQSAQPALAAQALATLVDHMPDFPGALSSLASLVFPGPPYREVLARLHEVLRPRTYLEIGVEHGTTLALAIHSRQVVGVDPVPRPPTRNLPAGARSFHMTSDAFFETQSRADVFGDELIDLAFIDGMHWFDYALRDFCNVERWCGAASTVVLHDCLPPHAVAAARDRRSHFWVGDTWKALECLLRERTDLRVSVIPCYPSGLVVIRNLDPSSSLLRGRLDALIRRYEAQPYPYAPGSFPSHYPLVPNSEPHLSQLFASLGASRPAGPA